MTVDTLWYTRCPAPTAASIAIRQGWLVEEFLADGIAVRSLASSSDKAVHLSHYQHTQPNSFRFGGYVPPLISRSRGADSKVIGLSWHDRVSGVFALPDSKLHSAADLKGRRLGVPRRVNDTVDWWRATVLAGYEQLLRTAKLRREDVTFVDIDIAREYVEDVTTGESQGQSLWGARSQFAVQREEIAALYRGTIDAIYSDAALSAILRATTGARPVVSLRAQEDDNEGGFGFPVVLTVSGTLLDARPDLVERWVGRLLDAQDWARSHLEQARRIFAADTGLPEDFVDLGFSARLPYQLDISLAPNRRTLLRTKYDHLLANGFLQAPFDFDPFIDERPLAAALARRKPVAA